MTRHSLTVRSQLWIQHPTSALVLGRRLGDAWSLPWIHVPRDHRHFVAVNEALSVIGLAARPCLVGGGLVDPRHRHLLWVCVIKSAQAEAPAGWDWLDVGSMAAADALSAADDYSLAAIQRWQHENVFSPLRASWLQEVSDWIAASIGGRVHPDDVTLVRSSFARQVARVNTPSGRVYFKGAFPPALNEPLLVSELRQLCPLSFPHVLRVDGERGWWLESDVGGPMPGRAVIIARLAEVFEALQHVEARVASGWARVAPLLRYSYEPRRVLALAVQFIDRALGVDLITRQDHQRLSHELQVTYDAVVPYLQTTSWMHTDLHLGNIVLADHVRFLDHAQAAAGPTVLAALALVDQIEKWQDSHDDGLRKLFARVFDIPLESLAPLRRWTKLTGRAIAFDAVAALSNSGDLSTPGDSLIPWAGRDVAEIMRLVN